MESPRITYLNFPEIMVEKSSYSPVSHCCKRWSPTPNSSRRYQCRKGHRARSGLARMPIQWTSATDAGTRALWSLVWECRQRSDLRGKRSRTRWSRLVKLNPSKSKRKVNTKMDTPTGLFTPIPLSLFAAMSLFVMPAIFVAVVPNSFLSRNIYTKLLTENYAKIVLL